MESLPEFVTQMPPAVTAIPYGLMPTFSVLKTVLSLPNTEMLLLPLLTTRMSLPLMAIPMRRRLQRPSRPQYRHSDQLHHRAAEEVRNPDARPVKGKAEWTIAYGVSAEHRACGG